MFNLKFAALYGKFWHRKSTSARDTTIAEIRLERMRESWLRTLANLRHQASLRYQDQGGLTHMPEVGNFTSSAQLTGPLALDDQGNLNQVFVFQIRSTLVATTNSLVAFLSGATGGRAYWQIGSPATFCTDTLFADNDIALTSISFDTSVSVQFGRAAARNGSEKLETNKTNAIYARLPASSAGTKLYDLDSDGKEPTEPRLAGVTVFHDLKDDGHTNAAATWADVDIEDTQVFG